MVSDKTQSVSLDLDKFDVEYDVQPTGSSGDYWASTCEFTVKLRKPTLWQKLNGRHHFGDLLYLLVCSPSFKANPDWMKVDKVDLEYGLIQEKLDEEAIRLYIIRKVSSIRQDNYAEALSELGKLFITEYDDYSIEELKELLNIENYTPKRKRGS